MEKRGCKEVENTTDLFLKWGNKKRLRCVTADSSSSLSGRRRIRRKINSPFVNFCSDNNNNNNDNNNNNNNNRDPSVPLQPSRLTRHSEAGTGLRSEGNRRFSPEKEDKLRMAAVGGGGGGGGGGGVFDEGGERKFVWPKLYIALSSKEKEEDFMAMKGCKPSHRPKKRAKMIQRTILLVSPGAWLTDMCQERYEVREKKTTKKRPTGLKAMGSMESDSE